MINGANGISALIVSLFRNMRKSPTTAPIQKAMTIAENPSAAPSRKPTEAPSFASPKPIALPRDKSHIAAKNIKIIIPANKCLPNIKDRMIAK